MKQHPSYDISDFVPVITPERILSTLVANVKLRRKEHGLSQRALAQKSGVSYPSVRRFETTGEIALTSLLRIAAALDALSDFLSLFDREYLRDLKEYRKNARN